MAHSQAVTRTQYYTATSLDGFIADEKNSLDWLFEVGDDDGTSPFDEFFAGVGAIVMGSTTYEWVVAAEQIHREPGKWQAFYGDRPSWVFSHRDLRLVDGAKLNLVSGAVEDVFPAIEAGADEKNIWVAGGGDLAGQFADARLLDEIIVGIAPVTLGGGAPLLPRRLTSSRLTLSDVTRVGPYAYLTYEVGRGST